jgi:FkbM family methyltransferase
MKKSTLKTLISDMISEFIIMKFHERNKKNINESHFKPRVVYAFDYVGLSVSLQGIYEKKELFALVDFLDKSTFNGIFLDVGANIGNHTLFFRNYFKNIISFEPHKLTFQLLKLNTQDIEGITIHNFGLSDKNEIAVIHSHPSNFGGAHLSQYSVDQKFFESNEHIEFQHPIELKKLDDIDFKRQKISLIKIDVEGHEFSVIKGAIQLLKEQKPILLLEQREIDFSNDGESELINQLIELGYTDFYSPVCNIKHNEFKSILDLLINILKASILGVNLTFRRVNKFEKKYYSMIIAK